MYLYPVECYVNTINMDKMFIKARSSSKIE